MDTIAGLPFFKLEFGEKGDLTSPQQLTDLVAHIKSSQPARLAVVSHGWRNSADDATSLYTELFTNVSNRLKQLGVPQKDLPTVVGVYWPSMALPEFGGAQPVNRGDGVATATAGVSVDPTLIERQLDALSKAFGGQPQIDQAKALLDSIEDRPSDQARFVELLRAVALPLTDASEDNSDRFFGADAGELFDRLTRPVFEGQDSIAGAAASDGDAAGLADALSGAGNTLLNAAQGALGSAFRLVNYLTFYQMKERAGIIGGGLNRALAEVRKAAKDLPIHLVGHSFGARVVTAAAARGAGLDPCSLSLLQAAYSHNGLAAASEWDGDKDGFFRAIFAERRVKGPIMATHTANDEAVGVAYPIASRLAGDNASALGDANDPFGGVGRNGVLHVHAAERGVDADMTPPEGAYVFKGGKTNNLLADKFVADHGDVKNPAVANAIAHVIKSL